MVTMRLIRRPRLQRSGCICLAITALFIIIILLQYNQKHVLSPFLKYMPAGGTTTRNTSIYGYCSPCECTVISTPALSVDAAVPKKGASIAPADGTLPHEDEWKFTFGRDERDLALDDHDCDAAFPELFNEINRATQFRGNRFIMLEELTSIKISSGMVHAMIHGKQVISPAQVVNIIDRCNGVAIRPCSKFSRSRTSQERRCYSSNTISSNYGNPARLSPTQY